MGVYLSEPETSKNLVKGQNNELSFVCAEMQGWRKNMEDAAIHETNLDGNSVFGVFDGHGGPEVSAFVKRIFIKELTSGSFYKNGDYVNALQQTFKRIDALIDSPQGQKELKAIRGKSNNNEGTGDEGIANGTGCTANIIIITPNKIFVANAGDSRSALSKGGKAVQLSYDHKPESEQEEKRIRNAGGTITMGRVNGGLNLTRSFGDFDYKRKDNLRYDQQMITCKPDVLTFDREKGKDEFIIMGCDGIWEQFVQNSQGIIDLIKPEIQKGKDMTKIIEELLDRLLAKDTSSGLGCDNMTAILIKFK